MTEKERYSEITNEWIKFGKQLKEDEKPELNINEKQWEWFGQTMYSLKSDRDFPTPSGSECRSYPRNLFYIIENGMDGVEKFLLDYIKSEKFYIHQMTGGSTMYDLIGYGVHELFEEVSFSFDPRK